VSQFEGFNSAVVCCLLFVECTKQFLDLASINGLTGMALSSVSLWCCALEELSLVGCACFEDESLHMLLRTLPLLMLRISRFPNSNLKPVDVWVHRAIAQGLFCFLF
jgi:hypothetical protein